MCLTVSTVLEICIACLGKPKVAFRKLLVTKNGENTLETIISNQLYENYLEHKNFLPKSICVNCKVKLSDSKKSLNFPFVDYIGLVNSVKLEVSKASDTQKCVCEICRLACANQNNGNFSESQFLLIENSQAGPSQSKQSKISAFFGQRKGVSKHEKLDYIVENTDQYELEYFQNIYCL